jgi:DNA-directed RNA polymerase subunit RPC12/RpoP
VPGRGNRVMPRAADHTHQHNCKNCNTEFHKDSVHATHVECPECGSRVPILKVTKLNAVGSLTEVEITGPIT